MLALGLLTTRGITTLDEAIHLDTADGWARGRTTLSVDPGDLWVPTSPMAGGLFYDAGDGLRAASPPGMALLALPPVAPLAWLSSEPVGDALSPLARESSVDDALRALRRDPRALAFALIGPVSAALTLLFFLLAARALELSPRAQWFGLLGLGAPLLVYAGTCWTQLPVTALLAYALWQVVERDRRPGLSATGLGLALGVAVLVRAECLLFAIPFGVATYRSEHRWRRSPSRSLLRLIVPVAAAVAMLVFLGLPSSGGGWSLETMLVGVPGLLVGPQAGLLLYAPFVVLCGPGYAAARRTPLIWPLAGVPLLALVVYGGWFDWPASLAYGPRFLLPALPMLALAFARGAERWPRAALIAIAMGFVIGLPGVLIVHARVAEIDAFWDPTPLRAYAAVRELDWAILDSMPLAVLLLLVAVAGLVWERVRRQRSS